MAFWTRTKSNIFYSCIGIVRNDPTKWISFFSVKNVHTFIFPLRDSSCILLVNLNTHRIRPICLLKLQVFAHSSGRIPEYRKNWFTMGFDLHFNVWKYSKNLYLLTIHVIKANVEEKRMMSFQIFENKTKKLRFQFQIPC